MKRVFRACAPYVICVAIYLACTLLFSYASAREGLISPSGAPHFGVLVLGIAALGTRLVALFVLPFLGVYQLLGQVRMFKRHAEGIEAAKG